MFYSAGTFFNLGLAALLFAGAELYVLYSPDIVHPAVLFFRMVGGLSLFTAAFNFLPVPPLDGGRLFLIGTECVRGKPLSDEVNTAIDAVGVYVLFAVMISMVAIAIFYFDDPENVWDFAFPL